jgi:hypothetical protein
VSTVEKYRRPAGPAAARNSSVPTAFPAPSMTLYEPTGTTRV